MSRMTITAAALAALLYSSAAASESVTADTALSVYAERTQTRPNCRRARLANEIVVCGRRDADKYRIPFIVYDAGDPRGEGRPGERERLQHRTTPCQDHGPFLVGCGSVGVSISTRFDGTRLKLRKLAD